MLLAVYVLDFRGKSDIKSMIAYRYSDHKMWLGKIKFFHLELNLNYRTYTSCTFKYFKYYKTREVNIWGSAKIDVSKNAEINEKSIMELSTQDLIHFAVSVYICLCELWKYSHK